MQNWVEFKYILTKILSNWPLRHNKLEFNYPTYSRAIALDFVQISLLQNLSYLRTHNSGHYYGADYKDK